MAALGEWWSDSTVTVYASNEDLEWLGQEHTLVIMNHSYGTDFIFTGIVFDHFGLLGNLKGFSKYSHGFLPGIGWSWRFAELVFLNRSFDKDQKIINKQLAKIVNYPDSVMLMMCPEGTRFTKVKHEASVKFAQERGLTVLNHHLIPRTKGFTASLPVLKTKCSSIIDMQLVFDRKTEHEPTFSSIICGKSSNAHMYLRRITMSEVPDDEVEVGKWLQELFVRKDKLQTSFHETGDFFRESGVAPLRTLKLGARVWSLVNFVGWMVIILTPTLYWLVSLTLSCNLFNILVSAGVIFVCESFGSYKSSR